MTKEELKEKISTIALEYSKEAIMEVLNNKTSKDDSNTQPSLEELADLKDFLTKN